MKLSMNFVKDYIDIDEDVHKIAEDMTNVGNEYDDVYPLLRGTNLVVGEVKECEKHPDSNHLHLCKVDVGTKILNIVCGAPNVRKGLKVIVALEGAELPGGTIKRQVIKGKESNGMLCSMEELGLEHKFLTEVDKIGIHELPEDAPIGEDAIKYLQMDDEIIDFELTADRGDLLSILGMAYELGAIYDKKVKDIDLSYTENKEDINDTFKAIVKTENCPILLTKKVKNIKIEESPEFIKNRLMASGIRPINNVVDISNYVMLETGQPLHFYDADTLKGQLEVRMAKKDEKLTTLDGKERILSEEDIVISDGERPIGLAGTMGGLDTEITDNTKNVLIEAAIFNPMKIRKTSNKILRSEASNRFEKGLDPNRTYMALKRACHMLEKYADGEIVGGVAKYDVSDLKDKKIEITFTKIEECAGDVIPKEDVLDALRRLGFGYELKENDKTIEVSIPTRRIDVNIKEDLIEEIIRIYGANKIKSKLPATTNAGSYDKVTRELKNRLVGLGLNETLTYILVNDKEAKQFTKDDTELVPLLDPMSEDRNTLRHSVLPSLMKVYENNKARSNKDVSIFEIAKAFYKKGEEYGESNKLAVLMTGAYYLGIGNERNVDFYVLKGVLEEVLDFLGYMEKYDLVVDEKRLPDELHPGQAAMIYVDNEMIGVMGKVHPAVTKDDIFVFEIDLDVLLKKQNKKMKYNEISKYPSVKKDIAILIDRDVTSKEIERVIEEAGKELLKQVNAFDVYTGKGIDENKKSITYSLVFENSEKTLTDEEINGAMENIITELKDKLDAQLRK